MALVGLNVISIFKFKHHYRSPVLRYIMEKVIDSKFTLPLGNLAKHAKWLLIQSQPYYTSANYACFVLCCNGRCIGLAPPLLAASSNTEESM